MIPKRLQLFKKKKGIYINNAQLVAITLTVLLIAIALLDDVVRVDLHPTLMTFAVIWGFYLVGLMIYNFSEYEKAYGKFEGNLVLYEDKISIDEREIRLSEIKKISFESSHDVKGAFTNHTLEFSPHLSNGVDNVVKIFLKNGERIEYNFLQTKSHRIKNYKALVIHYHKKGIIEWLHLLNILDISNFKEIQLFKEELKKQA